MSINNVTRYAVGAFVGALLVHIVAGAWWRLGAAALVIAAASVLYQKYEDRLLG